MECRDVRELLAERALGTLDRETARWVDRHLAWCAGCRKEAEDLAGGVAALPLAVGGPAPPPELEDRVVHAVSRAAGRPSRGRRLAVVAAAIAGVVAVASLSWALSVRDRIGFLERAAGQAERDAELSAVELARIIEMFSGQSAPSATLVPVGRGSGGGRAVVYDSPGGHDLAVVIVGGLPEGGRYHAALVTAGRDVALGRLSPTGPAELSLSRIFGHDIPSAEAVVVRDARGRDVLRGRLSPSAN